MGQSFIAPDNCDALKQSEALVLNGKAIAKIS